VLINWSEQKKARPAFPQFRKSGGGSTLGRSGRRGLPGGGIFARIGDRHGGDSWASEEVTILNQVIRDSQAKDGRGSGGKGGSVCPLPVWRAAGSGMLSLSVKARRGDWLIRLRRQG